MSVLETVKTAKRISHDKLDSEIGRIIQTGRDELVRMGVDQDKAASDDNLIIQAVVTYSLMELSGGDLRDQYERAWIIQADQLRKSEGYRCTTISSSSEE